MLRNRQEITPGGDIKPINRSCVCVTRQTDPFIPGQGRRIWLRENRPNVASGLSNPLLSQSNSYSVRMSIQRVPYPNSLPLVCHPQRYMPYSVHKSELLVTKPIEHPSILFMHGGSQGGPKVFTRKSWGLSHMEGSAYDPIYDSLEVECPAVWLMTGRKSTYPQTLSRFESPLRLRIILPFQGSKMT